MRKPQICIDCLARDRNSRDSRREIDEPHGVHPVKRGNLGQAREAQEYRLSLDGLAIHQLWRQAAQTARATE